MSAVNRISEVDTLGVVGGIFETSKTFSPFSSLLLNILYHPEQHRLLYPMGLMEISGFQLGLLLKYCRKSGAIE
jgi:hypothetical protein